MEMENIKCVLIGDEETGKSSMLTSYLRNSCPGYYLPTILDKYNCTFVNNGRKIILDLFDTSGSKHYDPFRPQGYPQTDVILICFSVMRPKSLRNVEHKWLPEAKQYCPNAKIILVGTKIDLRYNEAAIDKLKIKNQEFITRCQGLEMAKKLCAFKYVECSALTQSGLEEVFKVASSSVLLSLESPKFITKFMQACATLKRKSSKLQLV